MPVLTSPDLADPAARAAILATIRPEDAPAHHDILRAIFRAEMAYRAHDGVLEHYENIYWCGLLLFHVGALEDVPTMWAAKRINMDTGVGFDIQALVGAGVDATIDHLAGRGHAAIADALCSARDDGDLDDLAAWAAAQRAYFYGDD